MNKEEKFIIAVFFAMIVIWLGVDSWTTGFQAMGVLP